MKRSAAVVLLVCLLILGVVVSYRLSLDRGSGAGSQPAATRGDQARRSLGDLSPLEIRETFAEIVKRVSKPLITWGGETVTGLEIGDPKDPDGGPIASEEMRRRFE